MSEKRALRFVNETEGERELRRFHFTLKFYAVMVLLCFIITAGGTYTWGQMKEREGEEKNLPAAVVIIPEETTATPRFEPVDLNYIEVISSAVCEPRRDVENPLYECVPLDAELQLYVASKCAEMGISPAVVFAMMHHESRYALDAVGDNGRALGLLQVRTDVHGERMARLGCEDLFDPYNNVTVALDYLGELLERYNGEIIKALTAYNRGHYSGVVTRYAHLIIEEAERIGVAG